MYSIPTDRLTIGGWKVCLAPVINVREKENLTAMKYKKNKSFPITSIH